MSKLRPDVRQADLYEQAVTACESEMPFAHDDFVNFEKFWFAPLDKVTEHGEYVLSPGHPPLECDNCPWRTSDAT